MIGSGRCCACLEGWVGRRGNDHGGRDHGRIGCDLDESRESRCFDVTARQHTVCLLAHAVDHNEGFGREKSENGKVEWS